MMSPLARLILALTLVVTINLSAIADVILLRQSIQETLENSASGLERPTSGMSMSQVTMRFGEPLEQRGPIGDPPITRWLYEEYTVYFERDRVINTVVRRPTHGSVEASSTH
jgi:hypothetical protein